MGENAKEDEEGLLGLRDERERTDRPEEVNQGCPGWAPRGALSAG